MAALLREHEYELRPVLAALFTSEAFYSAPARVGLVKSPVEQVVGFVRSTGLLPADRKNPHTPDVAPPNLLHTLDVDLERLEQPCRIVGHRIERVRWHDPPPQAPPTNNQPSLPSKYNLPKPTKL